MSWILAAFISFLAFYFLSKHLAPQTMRRIVGYIGWVDLALHGSIILLFIGTFQGLMQAEATGILFSLYLRWYRWAWGYERYGWYTYPDQSTTLCWIRTVGRFTRITRAPRG